MTPSDLTTVSCLVGDFCMGSDVRVSGLTLLESALAKGITEGTVGEFTCGINFLKKLPKSESPTSCYFNNILAVGFSFYNYSNVIPFLRGIPTLVL